LTLVPINAAKTQATQTAILSIKPQNITNPSLTINSKFTVNVTVENIMDLYGWQIKLFFNSSILNCTTASLPSDNVFAGKSIVPVSPVIDNVKGYVLYGCSLLGGASTFSGNGTLCQIEFKVKAVGWSYLNFSQPYGEDTFLWDSNAKLIPADILNGYFNNVPPIKPTSTLYISPHEIIDPSLLPGSTFNVNVTIDKVEKMRMCTINITYDTNVISWVGLDLLNVQNVTPTANAVLNDQKGYMWINLTYPTSVTTLHPAALVAIRFSVDAFGATTIHLKDTKMFDEMGVPIPHDTVDGYFCTLIHDVAIVNIHLPQNWAYKGWKLNITVTAKNLGNVNETFNIEVYYDNNLVGLSTITSLPPGEKANATITWDTIGVQAGNYTIEAVATQVPYEYNVTNNILVYGKVWIMEKIHDVAITNLTLARNYAYQNLPINVTVSVKNLGNYTETFDVNIFYDESLMHTFKSVSLTPGQQTTLVFTWNTSNLQLYYNYTIRAETTQIPYEYNVTNNVYVDGTFEIRLLGDINNDKKVDMKDIIVAAKAFGTFPGESRWNPDADVNLDGTVDMRDIIKIARNFGKTY
jgi:hypothetical protein